MAEGTGFTRLKDRSLHFTMSLHIDNDRIATVTPDLFEKLSGCRPNPDGSTIGIGLDSVTPEQKRRMQIDNQLASPPPAGGARPLSQQLRDAMEPMFSDIADRERLGLVEDYLIAIAPHGDDRPAKDITTSCLVDLRFDSTITWSTEGDTYEAILAGNGQPALRLSDLPMRRFWYVHRNNSLSWHLSLKIEDYAHTPQYFYLFSVLQKLVSPKEFSLPDPPTDGTLRQIGKDSTPPISPFLAIHLRESADNPAAYQNFWQFVLDHFEADFRRLHRDLTALTVPETVSAWNDLLKHDPYVEVPGLAMPNVRSMFYFADRVFQDLLLPRLEDGSPARRHDMMREAFFEADLAAMLDADTPEDERAIKRIVDADENVTWRLGADLWSWLDRQQAAHEDAVAAWDGASQLVLDKGPIDARWLQGRWNQRANERVPGLDPMREPDGAPRRTNLALDYLFLAGFNQNIIDFVNQDSSEVLDSLDPIYPFAGDDVAEGLFARYANPRSLITYVRKMRSLDAGDDYIGTCPYAFLIHVLTIHNEFLTRDFEISANRQLQQANGQTRADRWQDAAETFYHFRENQIVEYDTYHYKNVFRYDTEGKVFEEMQRIRGIEMKHDYVMALIDGAEKRTADNEERVRREDERNLDYLVFFIGLFSIFQVAFQATDALKVIFEPEAIVGPVKSTFVINGGFEWAYAAEIGLSVLAILAVPALLGVYFTRRNRRRRRNAATTGRSEP